MFSRYLNWKNLLLLIAIAIATISLFQVNKLIKDMEQEEYKDVQLLVDAIKAVVETSDIESIATSNSAFTFATKVIEQNKSIPIIITDTAGNIQSYNNLDSIRIKADSNYLKTELSDYKLNHGKINVDYGYGTQYLYYGESEMLRKIKQYPLILLSIIGVFFLVIIIALSNAQKNMQNQVWVGMSKETAHQLGTPLTSVFAWMELLKENEENLPYILEMEKDVHRLQLIADRFSKIGSVPQLIEDDLVKRLKEMVDYMQKRAPINVDIQLVTNKPEIEILLIGPLFDWVIENLIRNALDAMEGKGNIKINVVDEPRLVTIDVCDTGKGITKNKFKKIFQPGFTTKKRGWGLGLSLAKRIIHQYHNGSIFVKHSELGKGTTFRIILRR